MPRLRPPCRCILLVLCLLPGLAACRDEPPPPREIPFRVDGSLDFLRPDSTLITRIAIEIAATDSARARGLMERRSLPQRGGMLFVYDHDSTRTFWMRNTPLPLDILFIGADGRIVNIARRTRPYSDDLIRSRGPARHVLEVRAGFTDLLGIDTTTFVRWRRR
ncbi:DUF192 domain-containing protein [Rhodocaloribacter litoris]|uniref:DUF192 domain-containing protein n=1 Tax=Rhodocaloribacter litoris TaxID=2558931 RepID=UPI001420EA2B|nr:DUF192 domain-containing protein [Rhodocaloribacter litoris]QXD15929.1 DUF192 domain-containing protein [Rhodocaloribacter litoris]